MIVLGIESSCDECSCAIVEDGKRILSNTIKTQLREHVPYQGVVPELASRLHVAWIQDVVSQALADAGLSADRIEGVAATARPGLSGSLLVGFSFAKAWAWVRGLPFVGVDHVRAHLYAPHMDQEIPYPYLGLLVSGGHTLIVRVKAFDEAEVMGATIDDAVGEAFDKVAKFYGMGYPGGQAVDRLAQNGNPKAFRFPDPVLNKGAHRYNVSYSGLKTAAINQLDLFWDGKSEKSLANIAASFQMAAMSLLVKRLKRASEDTGLRRVVVGGGVAANSLLRRLLSEESNLTCHIPPSILCTDNGAMIAGYGGMLLLRGERTQLDGQVSARVQEFKRFVC